MTPKAKEAIERCLSEHRGMIICEETCWCWDLAALLEQLAPEQTEPPTHLDHAKKEVESWPEWKKKGSDVNQHPQAELGPEGPPAGEYPIEQLVEWLRSDAIPLALQDGCNKAAGRLHAQAKEIERITKLYNQYTLGLAEHYHDISCNASRHEPMGCPGCSCAMNKKVQAQQQEIERLKTEKGAQQNWEDNCIRLEFQKVIDRLTAENAKLRGEAPIPDAWWKDCPELAQRTMERIMKKNEAQAERVQKLANVLSELSIFPTWATNEAGLSVKLCIELHNDIIDKIRKMATKALAPAAESKEPKP